ncbi:vitamin K epoxide reductase family protein [Caldisphaera sp.]|uniref:vitamin K epoxide reductase family protein n=1 Tax=Caldisphaera sp. TaxID=2060322 RepID=UPI003D130DCE
MIELKLIPTIIFITISIAGIGAALTSYYYVYMANTSPPACHFSGNITSSGIELNCLNVLKSSYSSLSLNFGVKVNANFDVLAIIYFSVSLILSLMMLFTYYSVIAQFIWSIIGASFIPYLVYLEIYVIRSICIYCTTMHILIISQVLLSLYYIKSKKLI